MVSIFISVKPASFLHQSVNDVTEKFWRENIEKRQGDQIGQNFTIWAIFYGLG
jgi:hypothetical protein